MQSQGPHRGVCLAEGHKESSCGYPQATGEALFSLGDRHHLEKEQSKWKMSSVPLLLLTAQSPGLSISMELLGYTYIAVVPLEFKWINILHFHLLNPYWGRQLPSDESANEGGGQGPEGCL